MFTSETIEALIDNNSQYRRASMKVNRHSCIGLNAITLTFINCGQSLDILLTDYEVQKLVKALEKSARYGQEATA